MTETQTSPLEALRAELNRRGWTAEIFHDGGPVLYVANPTTSGMHDKVTYNNGTYRWAWGTASRAIGTDVPPVADHITHIMRDPNTP